MHKLNFSHTAHDFELLICSLNTAAIIKNKSTYNCFSFKLTIPIAKHKYFFISDSNLEINLNFTDLWFLAGGMLSPVGHKHKPLHTLQYGKFFNGEDFHLIHLFKSGGLKQRKLIKGGVVEERLRITVIDHDLYV